MLFSFDSFEIQISSLLGGTNSLLQEKNKKALNHYRCTCCLHTNLTVKEQIEIEDAKASSNHTPHRTAAHRGYTARHRREGSGEDEQPLPSLCRAGRRLPAAVPLALSASQRVFRAWRR